MNRCLKMKNEDQPSFRMVLVTTPDLKTARQLARLAMRERLIAGANLISTTESHQPRRGRPSRRKEVMMVIKTTQPRLPALRRLIVANLPGTEPEYLILPVSGGGQNCLMRLAQFCA